MALRLLTAPYAEPISLVEAKAHLRVDTTADDTLITALISSARQYCEDFQRRAYVAQTWRLSLDIFPIWEGIRRVSIDGFPAWDRSPLVLPEGLAAWEKPMELSRSPVLAVSSIKYYDTSVVQQTMSTAAYTVDIDSEPGRVVPATNTFWPSTAVVPNAVQCDFVAGQVIPFTADATSNVLTWQGHTPTANQVVRLSNSGGALPTGLAVNTDYYVRDVSGSTCKLAATSGGAAIDITSAGTGTNFIGTIDPQVRAAMLLLIGQWYWNREAAGKVEGEIAFSVSALLWMRRVM